MIALYRTRTLALLLGCFGLVALLLLARPGAIQAQTPADDPALAASVETSINYQGLLSENGELVNGTRTMAFRFYTDDTCTAANQVGSTITETLTVSEGLFQTALPVDHGLFNGQMLSLQVEVSGEMLGCTPLLPAPYALNLVPGAEIDSDAATSIFRAINQNTAERTRALYGKVFSTVDDSAAVYGHAQGASGATYGLYGKTDSASSGTAGVYATTTYTGTEAQVYGVLSEVNAPNARAIQARNDATSGQARAVYGRSASESDGAQAIYGHAAGATGATSGVYGKADSSSDGATGVYGEVTATEGRVYGLYGYTLSPDGRGVQAINEATTGQARAVYGRSASESDGAQAIYGHAAGAMGETSGVYGRSDSPDGYGVYGLHNATDLSANGGAGVYATSVYTGSEYQVYGVLSEVNAPNARAIQARNEATSGQARAVYGRSASESDGAQAIYGHATGTMGETSGVYGRSDSPDGYGLYGLHNATDLSANGGAGVYATSVYTGSEYQVYGVLSEVNAPNARAIQARNEATSGQARAVYGRTASESDGAQAIYGHAAGTTGETSGVYGRSDSPDGYGVYGLHNATDLSANGGAGVYATSVYTGSEYQVYGVLSEVNAPNARAIQARNEATSGQARAVYGRSASESDGAQAIYGHAAGAAGETSGVYGRSDSPDGYGVYGINTAGKTAGYFEGDVTVTGVLSATDLFLTQNVPGYDPNPVVQNAVGSGERLNIYTGRVTLDGTGTATVTLPDYFEGLNRDYTYQLTPIGGAAPDLYIASEVSNNQFTIAGGSADLVVSWQVTGVRR